MQCAPLTCVNYLTDINLEKVNNLFACLPISSTELGTQMEAPLRDTLGKYKLLAMYRGFERLLYPGVGEMREVWFTTTLHHREKPGAL